MEKRKNYPINSINTNSIFQFRYPEDIADRPILASEQQSAFYNTKPSRKIGILNQILNYKETSTVVAKNSILENWTRELIDKPDDCLTFFETLREYEDINRDFYSPTIREIRAKLNKFVFEKTKLEQLKSLRTENDLEKYFAPLIEVIISSDPTHQQSDLAEQARADFSQMARQMIRSYTEKAKTTEELVTVLTGISIAGLAINSREADNFVLKLFEGKTELYRHNERQQILIEQGIMSEDNMIGQRVFLLDTINGLLKTEFEGEAAVKVHRGEVNLKTRNIQDALPDDEPRTKIERGKRIQAFLGMINAGGDTLYEMDPEANLTEKYRFPMNMFFRESRFLELHNQLAERVLNLNSVHVAIPFDQTIRPLISDPDDEQFDFESALRKAYNTAGEGFIISSKPYLQNVFTYLKPEYEDEETGVYKKAKILQFYTDPYAIKDGLIGLSLQIGRYVLPCYFDLENNTFYDNNRSIIQAEGGQIDAWKKFVLDQVGVTLNNNRRLLIESTATTKVIEKDHDGIKYIMILMTPYDIDQGFKEGVTQKAVEFNQALVQQDDIRILHPFGTIIKVKKNNFSPVSSFQFSYGDNGRIDLNVNFGKLTLKLYLDNNFDLHFFNGEPLDLPEWSLHWWKSLTLSHLSEYMLKEGKSVVANEYFENIRFGDQAEFEKYLTIRRPHRRHIPFGKKFTSEHNLEVENHPLMQGLVTKIPRVGNESFLEAYNRVVPSGDDRLWNWVIPPTEEKIAALIASGRLKKKPIIINTPEAMNYL